MIFTSTSVPGFSLRLLGPVADCLGIKGLGVVMGIRGGVCVGLYREGGGGGGRAGGGGGGARGGVGGSERGGGGVWCGLWGGVMC